MGLQKVDLAAPETQYSIVLHGDTGSGKTRFASSWPRPLFLSPADEMGWETLRFLDPSNFYEPDRKPIVWKLEKALDIVEGFKDVQPLIKSGEVKTIVIDSLTFWVEMYYDHLSTTSQSKDPRQVFGMLGDHLRNIRIKFQSLPVNIIWLCLTNHPDEIGKLATPAIKGRQATQFSAGCKYLWYMRIGPDGKTHEIRTRKFGNVLARGRDGGRLPETIPNPTYLKVHELLNAIPVGEFVDKSEEELIAEDAAEIRETPSETIASAFAEPAPSATSPIRQPRQPERQPVPRPKQPR